MGSVIILYLGCGIVVRVQDTGCGAVWSYAAKQERTCESSDVQVGDRGGFKDRGLKSQPLLSSTYLHG